MITIRTVLLAEDSKKQHFQEDKRKNDVSTGFSFLQQSKITYSTYKELVWLIDSLYRLPTGSRNLSPTRQGPSWSSLFPPRRYRVFKTAKRVVMTSDPMDSKLKAEN
jgi:hypothetical protein